MLPGVHYLALVTDDMRMTLDFYVRVPGIPTVHGLERLHAHRARTMRTGTVRRPTRTSPIIFLIWAATVCSPSLNIRKELPRLTATRIGAMQHVSFACGPTRYREILERLKANEVTINAGPLLVIPPEIHSFYFFDPTGIRLEISSDLDGDEEDLQVIRSCSMSETEPRAELETISTDNVGIDGMVAAMTPHGLGPVVPSAS
jgi:catechol 2,3-dioxygenase-like lactoylglutathione lyase family enzyme